MWIRWHGDKRGKMRRRRSFLSACIKMLIFIIKQMIHVTHLHVIVETVNVYKFELTIITANLDFVSVQSMKPMKTAQCIKELNFKMRNLSALDISCRKYSYF